MKFPVKTEDPAPVETKPKKEYKNGENVFKLGKVERDESIKILENQLNKGIFRPIYGKGVFRNHFNIGFTNVAHCGRYTETWQSGGPFINPSPKVCRHCASIYNAALERILEDAKAKRGQWDDGTDRAEKFVDVFDRMGKETSKKNFWKVISGYMDL